MSSGEPTRKTAVKSVAWRIAEALQSIRPLVREDGGDVEFVDIDEGGVVRVRLLGACIGCPSSPTTISLGIERTLKDRVPEVKQVVCV